MRVIGIMDYDNPDWVKAVVEQPEGMTKDEAYIYYARNIKKVSKDKTDQEIMETSMDSWLSLEVIYIKKEGE